MNRFLKIYVILILWIPIFVQSQDVEGLLSLISQGKIDSAEQVLSELSYTHPGNPGVRYARALMQTDALVAAGIYKDILRNHKNSQYVAGSLMHLGEYYFALGSYIQSRELFSRLIHEYPDYPEIVNAGNLILRAGIASRQMDKAYSDLSDLVKRYPDKAFDIPDELDLTRIPGQNKQIARPRDPDPQPLRQLGSNVETSTSKPKAEFILQAGAFGDYNNARRMADQIESIGYTTTIKERSANNKTLFLIWVGEYVTRTAALSAADMLEVALGIDSFPVAID